MIVVTLARKPLTGTVAGNSMKWGCGGVNIDASRIGSDPFWNTEPSVRYRASSMGTMGSLQTRPWVQNAVDAGKPVKVTVPSKLGRWPANLILSHMPGCHLIGYVPGLKSVETGKLVSEGPQLTHGARPNAYQKGTPPPPADRRNPDGTETVPVWICEDGCPVAGLDEQAGERPGMSGGGATDNRKSGREVVPSFNRKPSAPFIRGDTGGASRFFKQVRS